MTKTLYIMRGLPGSGKSHLAKRLAERTEDGVVLSTDEFFMKNGKYLWNPKQIGTAHGWNQKRATEAMENGIQTVVIDNTNVQAKEAKHYVSEGKRLGYDIRIMEPDSPWWKEYHKQGMKNKEKTELLDILVEKNTHNVPREAIERMLNRWEHDVSVQNILAATAR